MLQYVVDAAEGLKPVKKIIVIGRHHDEIKGAIRGKGISYVMQKEPKGQDALLARELGNFKGTVLVLNGDIPLISTDTLKRFISHSKRARIYCLSCPSSQKTRRHTEGYCVTA